MQELPLEGKVALVTGGSRGLGRAMVMGFAKAGADVIIASRKLGPCQEVADTVAAETGRRALAVACHTGNWEDLDRLTERAYAEMGHVDVLVNNAGVSLPYDDVGTVSESLYDKMLDVNVKGPFHLTQVIGERMAKGDGGSIIMVSSMASLRPRPYTMVYGSTKAALNLLTEGFAHAFAPRVRVNGLLVGPFFTDMWASRGREEFVEFGKGHTVLGRGGEPDEIVGAALFLASEASSFTTGALLKVDGGELG